LEHSPNRRCVPSHDSSIAFAQAKCFQSAPMEPPGPWNTPHQSYVEIWAPCNWHASLVCLECIHAFSL